MEITLKLEHFKAFNILIILSILVGFLLGSVTHFLYTERKEGKRIIYNTQKHKEHFALKRCQKCH